LQFEAKRSKELTRPYIKKNVELGDAHLYSKVREA
jgi:hypothetical protein